MLLPAEVTALRQDSARVPRRWLLVALLSLVAAIVPAVIYLPGVGRLDHVPGRTDAGQQRWIRSRSSGTAKRSAIDEYRVEVSWTLDDEPRRRDYRLRRNAPQEGEFVQVWVSPDEHKEQTSPTEDRLGLTLVSLSLAALAWIFSAFFLLPSRRRRRLLAVGNQRLAQAVPVDVRVGKTVLTQTAASATAPGPVRRAIAVNPVLYFREGSEPGIQAKHAAAGSWWLYLARTLVHGDDSACWCAARNGAGSISQHVLSIPSARKRGIAESVCAGNVFVPRLRSTSGSRSLLLRDILLMPTSRTGSRQRLVP